MSGIFNELKQTFSSPKQELDETSKAILDIENKKKAITQASNNEQSAIKSQISDEYRKIGETSYTLYDEGTFEVEKIAGMFQTVKGLYQTLEEKQAKLNEILGRYDEELKILKPAPVAQAGQGQCTGCGTAYIPGEMLFCSKCGSKLPEKASDVVSNIISAQPVCPSCNAALVPDSVFCASCGSKV